MISLVIPIFNEESLIAELVERSIASLEKTHQDFEILFIDDGSTDNSMELLRQAQRADERIKIIALSRNFGHQAAYTAGIDYAQGDYLVLMDGDLQDPPELIPEMLDILSKDEFDVVNGYRKANTSTKSKNLFSKIFHKVFNRISDLDDVEHIGNFSMMNSSAIKALRSLKEKTRYLPGLRHFIGFRKTTLHYEREERESGNSMSTRKLISLAFDAIFSFSKLPIKFCLFMGIIGICTSFLAGVYIILSKTLNLSPIGWSSTLTSIFFLGSIQLVFLGILGEYVFRIYRESQNRPIYFVREFYSKK
ncbi:glycosyltransferase family 2 protein [Labilibacter marinus]|uniref:glycosyltransferase family 2 protein n=1 Tax=Labilibacter marinus TaxID=1477105 RepID=UPI00094FEA6D|nr:glycosyltransferase family 2 protein [Labilibacter marinus]